MRFYRRALSITFLSTLSPANNIFRTYFPQVEEDSLRHQHPEGSAFQFGVKVRGKALHSSPKHGQLLQVLTLSENSIAVIATLIAHLPLLGRFPYSPMVSLYWTLKLIVLINLLCRARPLPPPPPLDPSSKSPPYWRRYSLVAFDGC